MVTDAKNRPCMDCGIKYPHYVMDLDHRDDAEKVAVVSDYSKGFGKKRLLEEIAKCDVVCSNCHRERTHRRRVAKAKTLLEEGVTTSRDGGVARFLMPETITSEP